MSGARALSGRDRDAITLDAVLAGELAPEDVRIHPETLERQAAVAEAHGNPQLAANLRRGAELALLDDAEVMGAYEALRPGRSSSDDLLALAARLRERGATLCAALVEEAADVHGRRGLVA